MKVQLERSFPLPASADTAWALLQDIRGVAGCMPGAKITERIDDRHYKGTMAVKFGPASLTFRGEVEVVTMDAATHTLKLSGKGTDTTGGSAAAMDLTARVEPVDAASCTLIGNSEVAMSGKAAAFGARLATSVADQVMKQFVANFAARSQALQAQAAAPAAATAVGAESAAATPAPPAPPPPAELNGLALIWAIIRDWVRSLFGAKGA
jgi:carbon monoxide dehydrogenase subunit G